MAKPRIIIADTEFEYVTRLQLIFVEEFFEKVDLEIITDEAYYDELFSTPQKADILVVSEELYDSTLQRHNISDIYVMSEDIDNEGTDELNIKRISKYTDRKNIINEIVSKSTALSDMNGNVKKETQIIVVTSASGGVGKTTIAMGLAASLEKNHKRVLYINAENLQTFQNCIMNPAPITGMDLYSKLMSCDDDIYRHIHHTLRKEMFTYLPPFKAALMSLSIDSNVYLKIALSAKKTNDFDYIIMDSDSAFDELKAQLINVADKVIIVTKQNKLSVMATNTLVMNINGINDEKYIFICNDFDKEAKNALISPEVILKFAINDYVEHEIDYDQNIFNSKSIQKIAFLLM